MKKNKTNAVKYAIALGLALVYVAPIYWMIITSFKTYKEAFQIPPILFKWFDFSTYAEYFSQSEILKFLTNSIVVTVISTFVAMVVGSFAAYALSRVKIPGGEAMAFFILASRFIPPISTVIPLYLAMRYFQLFDSLTGLIILYMAMNTPYAVWMMRGFFKEIPIEVEEAAWVEGCSRLGGFFRVVLPMSKPGLAATAVLTLIFAWNEFLFALVMTGSNAKTLPLSISAFMGEMGIDWNIMAAAGTTIMLPAMVFSVVVQRHMAKGLTFGALKG